MKALNKKDKLTPRQKLILQVIYNYLKSEGFPPTLADMRESLNIKSNQAILEHLAALENKGFIRREEGSARGIKILKKGYEVLGAKQLVPIIGTTAAGSFIEAIEESGTWEELSQEVSQLGDDLMMVKVSGDSMIGAGINDGDILSVKITSEYKSGDIVLARTEDGTTVKRFICDKDKVYLKPENPKYHNIPVTDDTSFIGKVIQSLNQPLSNTSIEEQDKKINRTLLQNPYYEKPKFKLYQANCLDILAELPEDSVDMVFADPPYLLSNGGFTVHAGRRVSVNKGEWDKSKGLKKDFKFHLEWIQAVRRVLKPQGTIWISGTYHSIYQCGFALQVAGFHTLNDIAWFKPNASPNLSCRFFTASHETLIWARKDKKARHIFHYDLMKNGQWPEDFIKKPNTQMRSVWAVGTPKTIEKRFGKHPTQKPEDLLKRIVLASTNRGDLVLDPFTGSSTTGIASYLLGRKFIGIDTEKKYLDLSIKRFEELEKNIKSKLFQFYGAKKES